MTALPDPSIKDYETVQPHIVNKVQQDLMATFLTLKMSNLDFLKDAVNKHKGIIEDAIEKYENQRIGQEIFLGSINNQFAILVGCRKFLLQVVNCLPNDPASKFGVEGKKLLTAAEKDLAETMSIFKNQIDFMFLLHPLDFRWTSNKGYFLEEPNVIFQTIKL